MPSLVSRARFSLVLQRGVVPIALGSGLWLGLYAGRVLRTGQPTFGFLLFNLFLALVPWLLAGTVAFALRRRQRVLAVLLAMGWLAFLPNAPYLVTDFIHLHKRPGVPLWYDALLLAAAALTGLLAGAFSIRTLEVALRDHLPARWVQAGLAVAVALAGVAIPLGRFERLNSWDLLFHPFTVLRALAGVWEPASLVLAAACAGLLAIVTLAARDAEPS